MNKEYHEMQSPTVSHENFKLCSLGRQYVFLVGTMTNKVCEMYDIRTNEWKLLPSLPEHSLTTFCFADYDYLNVIVFPFQVNTKVKHVYYRLDIHK